MRRRLLPVLAVLFCGAACLPASAAAAPAPFGHACSAQADGVRFCAAGAQRVSSFDGTPLDVDVTLPPSGNGPFPTIVMLHGYGGDKTDFESTTPQGSGPEAYDYNNDYYARQGFAVLNYTARGFGKSCGGGPTAARGLDCANGYIRLADQRYAARDTQYLVGQLVDQGVTKPGAIGVTGISYGGGQSMELAFLKNRVRLPNDSFIPWRSPKGTPLSITAAYPRWPWSDLVSSLIPNGRFLDFDNSTDGLAANPIGVPIQSYISGLYALGFATGYYCGSPPGPVPCNNPDANLTYDFAQINRGEPISAAEQGIAAEIRAHHQGYGLSGTPAPLLLESGWADDLFPPAESLRVYNSLRAADPNAPVSLQFGDVGHSRGSNKLRVNQAFNDQADAFFAHYLTGAAIGDAPAPGSVYAFTQTCPKTTPDGGPYRASSWPAIHPGLVRFGSGAAQTVTSVGGNPATGAAFDPIAGTSDACKTVPVEQAAGTAVYTLGVTGSGFTLLGLPTVRATIATTGLYGQLDSRLWDVAPDGTQRLITRGAYRLLDNQRGPVTFQLHGNGYHFDAGHTVKLELLGRDAPYLRPSNGAFSVQVSGLTVELPVAETANGGQIVPAVQPIHLSVRPGRVRAGQRRRFFFTATVNGHGAAGIIVHFDGRRLRTDRHGHTSVLLTLRRPGRYPARATGHALRSGVATVTAVRGAARHRPRPAPRFTG